MDQLKKQIYKLVSQQKLDKESAKSLLGVLDMSPVQEQDEIAVIGMSCRYPDAGNVDEFWENLKAGRDSVREYPEQRIADLPPEITKEDYRKSGYLSDIHAFDAAFFGLSENEARQMNPLQKIFLESSYEALEDGGYGGDKMRGSLTGVYVGIDTTTKYDYIVPESERNAMTMTGSWVGILSSRVSYTLDLRGPSIVVDTSCSSGMTAVHTAVHSLLAGDCTMAVAGGICVESVPAMKTDSLSMITAEDERLNAFDRSASGTVWGEGCGVLLLKPLKKAVEDGDMIYAVIKGSAVNNDGLSSGIVAPNARSQEEVILKAWANAGIDPSQLGYLEAHGTGTRLGDPIEVKGLTNAFGHFTQKKQFCPMGTVKTNIGHTVGASGIASIIKVIMMIRERMIVKSLHFREANEFAKLVDSPVYVADTGRSWDKTPRIAAASSFGLSGTNCHIVLGEWDSADMERQTSDKPGILALSAKDAESLSTLAQRYAEYLRRRVEISPGQFAYTANTTRPHHACRTSVIYHDREDLIRKLSGGCSSDCAADCHAVSPARRREYTAQAGELMRTWSMPPREEELMQLETLYLNGADIPWHLLYPGKHRKVHLPPYPFRKTVYRVSTLRGTNESRDGESSYSIGVLKKYWKQVLGREIPDPAASFYDLGGDSLLAYQLIGLLKEKLSLDLEVTDLYSYPSVLELDEYIRQMEF